MPSPGSPPPFAQAAAALALLLFGDPEAPMPGNFSSVELSANSPIKCIASFPQARLAPESVWAPHVSSTPSH